MIELNLLPPERKLNLAGKKRNRRITVIGAVAVVLLLAVAVALFGSSLYVGTVVSAQRQRIDQTKEDLKRFAGLEKLVLSIRDRVTLLSTSEKTRLLWSKVAEDLAAAVPEGVRISQVSLTTASTPHLQLAGEAENKEKIASLRERLELSARFENASIRQIGQNEGESGAVINTFSIEANLTGVVLPKPAAKPKGVGE